MTLEAAISVNRFGLGAMPGELARAAGDPRDWLAAQVHGKPPIYEALRGLMHSSEALKVFPRFAAKVLRDKGKDSMPQGVEQRLRDAVLPVLLEEIGARMKVAAATDRPFHERLVWFWSNHFTVSGTKPAVIAVAGAFEREAIRPNVGGSFADILLAATKHPGMIVYLDNHLSVAPGSMKPSRRRPNRPTGLNENLAREVLELHTLGVDGGYTQQDVTTFARVLTGWTVGNRLNPQFVFESGRHDGGAKSLLGKVYAQDGMAQGEAVLRDLAAHPSTARHLATKLARHFISDNPPSAAVQRIARAYLESGGDLPTVYATVVNSPEAWEQPLSKVKQPFEFVASALRALPPARAAKNEALLVSLNELGQRPYFAPSPQGWPDSAAAWVGADSLWKRIEWANAVASRLGQLIDPLQLARDTYGKALSENTAQTIMHAESRQQGLALFLASPEFQRR